jgi:hypothetical protein
VSIINSLKESLRKDSSLVADYNLPDWAKMFAICFPEHQIMGFELENVKVPEITPEHDASTENKQVVKLKVVNPRWHRGRRHRFQANFTVMPEGFDLLNIWPVIVKTLGSSVGIIATDEFLAMTQEVRRCRRMSESYIIRHSCEGVGSDYGGYSDYLNLACKQIGQNKLATMDISEYLMTFLFFINNRKIFMPSACNVSIGFLENKIQKNGSVQVPVITFNEGKLLRNWRNQTYSRANVSIVDPLRLIDPKKMDAQFLPSLTCELVKFDDKAPLPFKVIEVLSVKPK